MSLRLRSSDGFTVIEALVAALLLVIAAAAVMTALAGARKATYRGEQSQVANDIAQNEIEKLRGISYSKLAMTSTPASSSDPTDPRSRIASGTFNLNETGTADPAPLVVNGGTLTEGGTISGGLVNPGPVSFTSGDVSGTIQRFVVWRNDPLCTDSLCPGGQDYKRIIVAVRLDATASGGVARYAEIQSDMVDPAASLAAASTLPEFGTPTVAQQFWLSDQRCEMDTEPSTGTPLSHVTHNTLGMNCNSSRPNALISKPPTNMDNSFDYATDLEPDPPESDSGLQMDLPTQDGCSLLPGSGRTSVQTHIWLTAPLNLTGPYAMTGGATLKLWTKSINNVLVSGKLCAVFFRRSQVYSSASTVTSASDTVIGSATVTKPTWPDDEMTELTIPFPNFSATTLPQVAASFPKTYQRLGVAIGLDRSGGASNQFEFMYDSTRFDSRLEVETTTPYGEPVE